MLFNSVQYLVFYPIVFFVYFLLPKKTRYIWLLVASYYFYMCWNAKYALLMLLSTVVTYTAGLGMERAEQVCAGPQQAEKVKKSLLVVSLLINLGILFLFKYLNFAIENLNRLGRILHLAGSLPASGWLLPVGISFYTFQALGYLIDVYQGQTPAERDFFKYALFVSFFPQLVAGPIERSSHLLSQIHEPQEFQVQNARRGLLTMAYGLCLKMIVADNIAKFIDPIFETWQQQSGTVLLLAVVLFALQIYTDFNGYTQIAIGSARALGFTLMENFDAPYLATSIRDYWKRWHISLTLWFQDYLYMPLAMADVSRLTTGRRERLPPSLCIFLVFLCSGLWHGAGWHYVVWGGMNGLLIVTYDAYRQYRKKHRKKGMKKRKNRWIWVQRLSTFALVDFTMLFFRAEDMGSAIGILRQIVTDFSPWQLLSSATVRTFAAGNTELLVLAVTLFAILVVYAVDLLHEHKIDAVEKVLTMPLLCRWAIYLLLVLAILFWGVYGDAEVAAQFVYFQF